MKDLLRKPFWDKLDSEIGMLYVNWFLRIGALIVLTAYFSYRKDEISQENIYLVRYTLFLFFTYNILSGFAGIINVEWFLIPWVKVFQAFFEIIFYSTFYYLTKDPLSEVYFLCLIPLFMAVRFLNIMGVLLLIGFSLINLYIVLTNLTFFPSLSTADQLGWYWIHPVFWTRAILVIGTTLAYIARHRPLLPPELQSSQGRFAELFASLKDGVYVVDREQRLLFVNDALQIRHGPLVPGQLCSAYFRCEDRLCQLVSNNTEDRLPLVANKSQGLFVDKDGDRYPVEVSLFPLHNESWNLNGAIALVRDTEKPKQLELELKSQLRRYAQKVDTLTSQQSLWQETYYEMGKRLSGFEDQKALMQFVVEETKRRLNTETSSLFLVEDGILYRKAITPFSRDWLKHESYHLGEGITGQAILPDPGSKYGKPIRRNHVDQDNQVIERYLAAYKASLGTHHVKHLLAVPLNGKDKSFGVLRVVNKLDEAGGLDYQGFNQEDENFLVTIASMVAIALENARFLGQTKKRYREAHTLLEVSEKINANLRIRKMLPEILDELANVVSYDSISIQVIEDNVLKVIACRGFERTNKVLGLTFPITNPKFPNFQVINEKCALLINDVWDSFPHFLSEAKKFSSGHIRSWMGIPLIHRGKVIGMLSIDHKTPGFYTQEMKSLAIPFANHVAIAIANARLYEKAAQQAEMLSRLVKVSSGLIRHTELKDLLHYCTQQTSKTFRVEDCSLYLKNNEQNTIDLVYSSTIPPHLWRKRNAPLNGGGLTAYVARTGKTLNFGRDEYKDHKAWGGNFGNPFLEHLQYLPSRESHSLLIGPLKDSLGQNVGVLKLENHIGAGKGKRFSKFEVDMHHTLASQIGIAVERARLFQQLDTLARKEARTALGHDLHEINSFVHGALILRLAIIKEKLERNYITQVRQELENIQKAAQTVHSQLRWIHNDLRGDNILEEKGLLPALEHIAGLLGLSVEINIIGNIGLPIDVEYALHKIGVESLANTAKHSGKDTRVFIGLYRNSSSYTFELKDDGAGFDEDLIFHRPYNMGFEGMRRWAATIRATLDISSQLDQGTIIQVHGLIQQGGRK